MSVRLSALLALLLSTFSPFAAAADYLYRFEMVQAAPGKTVELTDLLRRRSERMGQDAPPLLMRHSQGDRWDLLLIYPMKSYAEFYSADRIASRAKAADTALEDAIRQDTAWLQDEYAYGPDVEQVFSALAKAGFFHIEMLHALPGKQKDLYKEREMESAYNRALGRPALQIFTRDAGADWDVISIDAYRDLQDYAGCDRNGGCAVASAEKQLAAARAAGYSDPDQIGPYLRSLIAYHHDTLAVAIPAASKR